MKPVRAPSWGWIAAGVTAVVALVVRAHGVQRGLIYPDGYDYLLMARGIGTHLTPTLQLGHGGELFVPSVDAALKPVFPAVIALLQWVSGARAAAEALTVAAGAATVALVGALVERLTGSVLAGATAAGLALLSPALAYWSGFPGPDTLAEALALATALALVAGRGGLAGALGALCAATRPEWLLALTAVALATLAVAERRELAGRALVTGAVVLGAVLLILRPPLGLPAGGLGGLLGALTAATALQLLSVWAAGRRRAELLLAACAIAGFLVAGVSGRVPALGAISRGAWPLLSLAGIGLLRACWSERSRVALILLSTMVVLGATYAYRNPSSGRYFAQLLPLMCVAAGLALAPLPSRSAINALRPVLAGASLLLCAVLAHPAPRLAPDTFATLAGRLARVPPGTLVSAAPDAYGWLLPGRPQQSLRAGARGLILLDGAAREYAPGLTARGVVIARLTVPHGFERPDGTIDTAPAVLMRGVVVASTTPRAIARG
jgi:hypothetical protein